VNITAQSGKRLRIQGRLCSARLILPIMDNHLLTWPAIVKHSNDAELTYVSCQSEWDNDFDLHGQDFDESDCIIDSTGKVFSLVKADNACVMPESSGKSMSLVEILGLIKAHAAQKGSCCVAKLYAPTIDDAFRIVASLEEM
jgi:hypothetical protein